MAEAEAPVAGEALAVAAGERRHPTADDELADGLLQRHRAFWHTEPADRPLARVGQYRPLECRQPYLLADGTPTYDGMLLSPELVDAHLERRC
ncbi:MAG: hypothetical protein HY332_09895 [Chloroflexi bacterium]|nr:hypothetical protein [Chloroflexota bacterium]